MIQRGRVELIKFEIGNPAACAPRHSNAIARRNIRIGGVLINFEAPPVASTTAFAWQVSTVSLFRFHTHAPTTHRVPGRPILSETIRSTALLRSSTRIFGWFCALPTSVVSTSLRWRRRHEEYDGDYVHLHESDGSFLRHSAECGYQTTPLVD